MDFLEPTRERGATLVDLIDKILDKGILINADIVVSPLTEEEITATA